MWRDRKFLLRMAVVIVMYALPLFAGQAVSGWALAQQRMDLRPSTQSRVHRTVVIATGLCVLLLMLPFMPGVEIGLGLMAVLGPSICFLVYLGTVTALVLAFAVGRLVPQTPDDFWR